jgi:hypothetical protein
MPRYARTSESLSVEYVDIRRPFSNFGFIETRFGEIFPFPLRRIMSQVRQHDGKTLVIEELDARMADDLREENEDIQIRFPSFSVSKAFRVSFFRAVLSGKSDLLAATPDEFLGYAIMKVDGIPCPCNSTRVYESVIRASRYTNNFIRGARTWECCVDGRAFPVIGYLYAEQNGVTNTCAHVALRTVAARYHENGDMSYREMNRLTGIPEQGIPKVDHTTRTVGWPDKKGLYPLEIRNILTAMGARCFLAQYMKYVPGNEPPPFAKYLYGSVESGYPAIVGFEAGTVAHHAIPVFGHTFNEDAWVQSAEWSYFRIGPRTAYVPSDSWLSAFIGHDDNWGSNFCIPRHFLQTRRSCDKLPSGAGLCQMESRCVAYVIGTFPQGVEVSSATAELIGVDYLPPLLQQLPKQGTTWAERLQAYFEHSLLVFRPVLITPSEYLSHLRSISDWKHKRIAEMHIGALEKGIIQEERLWMIEMSIPELFSANRRKIAEILLRAEVAPDNERDFKSLLLARLPGWFAIPPRMGGESAFRFVPSQVEDHVELYGCEERV